MEEILKFLEDVKTYYLATIDGDAPRVRPFGTILLFEGKLYIQTGKVKDVAKQIACNNNFEICAFSEENGWIRINGKLIADERVEAKKAMLDKYPYLRRMYDENDNNTIVYYFKDGQAAFYKFGQEPKIIKF